jgi:hypothetical protein
MEAEVDLHHKWVVSQRKIDPYTDASKVSQGNFRASFMMLQEREWTMLGGAGKDGSSG